MKTLSSESTNLSVSLKSIEKFAFVRLPTDVQGVSKEPIIVEYWSFMVYHHENVAVGNKVVLVSCYSIPLTALLKRSSLLMKMREQFPEIMGSKVAKDPNPMSIRFLIKPRPVREAPHIPFLYTKGNELFPIG